MVPASDPKRGGLEMSLHNPDESAWVLSLTPSPSAGVRQRMRKAVPQEKRPSPPLFWILTGCKVKEFLPLFSVLSVDSPTVKIPSFWFPRWLACP